MRTNTIPTFIIIATLILAAMAPNFFAFKIRRSATYAPATFSIQPQSATLSTSQQFAVNLTSPDNAIHFAQTQISFDPQVIKLTTAPKPVGPLSKVISLTDLTTANATGKILAVFGLPVESLTTPPKGTIQTLNLIFTPVPKTTRTKTQITFDQSKTQVVNSSSYTLTSAVTSATITIKLPTPTPTATPTPKPSLTPPTPVPSTPTPAPAPTPVSTAVSTSTEGTYQSESAVIGGNAKFENSNAGYNGSGYVNFPDTGGTLEFQSVDGGAGGQATLKLRNSLGAVVSRTGRIQVNGEAWQNITFDPTGAWTNWVVKDLSVTLKSGSVNTIRLETTGQDLANIDELTVQISAIAPPPTPTVDPTPAPVTFSSCGGACIISGYSSGVCRSSLNSCTIRGESHLQSADYTCIDVCCCK